MRHVLALLALLATAPPCFAQSDSGPVALPKGVRQPSGSPVTLLSGNMRLMELPSAPPVPEAIPDHCRAGLLPIFDEEGEERVIGFLYESQGVYRVFDLEGRMVNMHELPLRAPVVDPISIAAGGIATGLTYGLGAGLSSAARSLLTTQVSGRLSQYAADAASGYWKRRKAAGWKNAPRPQRAPYLNDQSLAELRETYRRSSAAVASQAVGKPSRS